MIMKTYLEVSEVGTESLLERIDVTGKRLGTKREKIMHLKFVVYQTKDVMVTEHDYDTEQETGTF